MNISTREAKASDAPFIAWVQLAAGRGHCERGFFDLAFTATGTELLDDVEALVVAPALSFHHWSRFLIAEVDGRPAAALSGYEPAKTGDDELLMAYGHAATVRGWAEDFFAGMEPRIAPLLECMTPTPDDHWVVEWVATLPEYRGRGLVSGLLQEMLERGRSLDYKASQISIMIGNDGAQRAYESAGFKVVDEKTSPQLDALLGTPGFRRLRRAI